MKHFNNSLDRNVNFNNIPEFEPDYSPKSLQTEKFIVFLLIALGVAGAIYTFNIGFKSSLSKATSQITKNLSLPVPDLETAVYSAPVKKSSPIAAKLKSQLQIVGIKEAHQQIKFTIDSYDSKAKYYLDLGNGVTLSPKNKTIKYTFLEPGNYHIQLKVSYNGKTQKIFSEDIEIFESIAIAPTAHQEY